MIYRIFFLDDDTDTHCELPVEPMIGDTIKFSSGDYVVESRTIDLRSGKIDVTIYVSEIITIEDEQPEE